MSQQEHIDHGDHGSAQQRIAQVIRALMATHGHTQGDLAAVTHLDQGAISKILTGGRRLDVNEFEAIASFYDVPVETFFAGADDLFRTRSFSTPELALIQGSGGDIDPEPTRTGRHLAPVH